MLGIHRYRTVPKPVLRLLRLGVGVVLLIGLQHGLAAGQQTPASSQTAPAAADPAAVGKWSQVMSWPVVAIHAHLLPNGKVLSWERKDDVLTTDAYLWDPATGSFTKYVNPYASLFCSGHTFLPDGTLLVAGGHHFQDGFGEKTATLFDYKTSQWSKGQDMNAGRWYPTACALANGEILVISGQETGGNQFRMNELPQVWQTKGGWRDLTGAAGRTLPLYPRMLLAPDGRAFIAAPDKWTYFLDTTGTGKWSDGPTSGYGDRDYGSAVLYEPGKVLIVGGGDLPLGVGPTATAETIDLNANPLQWKPTDPMAFARRQLNATLLPDGKVLVTGGTSAPGFNNATGSVLAAELWDPATGHWTTMAAMSVRRLYHSTAVLLRDGTVLSAGGGMPPSPEGGDTDHRDAQIYSPPYLFKGPRPTITSAPKSIGYGSTFAVGTPQAASIGQVTLIRLASVTHAFDQSQRFARLRFSQASGRLSVTAPASSLICPPGPYLLFIVTKAGVPSVAEVVSIPG
jgi:hypothetical protein